MKKYIILLILLMPWQYAMAGVVTKDQARKHAAEFFSSIEKSTKASDVSPSDFKLLCTFPVVETKSSASEPALFVFERESGGYAIVAGDDVARPILGFSPDGYFPVTDMPDNMRAMLQWYSDIIEYARSQHWRSQVRQSSNGLENSPKVLLRTAQWSQGSPFNDLTPEIGGKKTPIGCVATAVAIIMRYHCWPSMGTGILPGYDFWDSANQTYRHIDDIPLDHVYNWDLMPDGYYHSQEYTDEEKAQIARLLFDVASMLEMSYSPSGSGGDWNLVRRLTEFFGYDKSLQSLARTIVPIDALSWEQLVKDEIDEGRPVYYDGLPSTGSSGHAYVIDGYFDRFFSINWGWGGMGYAAIDPTTFNGNREWRPDTGGTRCFYSLTPIEGYESELNPYYNDQFMVTHIMPDQGGESITSLFVMKSNITFLDYSFQLGKKFWINSWVKKSDSAPSITRDFRYVLFDKRGQVKEMVSDAKRFEIPTQFYLESFDCVVTNHLSDGDRILLTAQNPDTGKWEPIPAARRNQIVFTSRPLSELIEVGYVDPQTPGWGLPKDIMVTFYKDICWDIWDNNKNRSYFNSASDTNPYSDLLFNDSEWYAVSCSIVNSDDIDSDRVLCRLALPTGSYTLRANNPVTGEKMEIKLEL